jgi:hypothetical protein
MFYNEITAAYATVPDEGTIARLKGERYYLFYLENDQLKQL